MIAQGMLNGTLETRGWTFAGMDFGHLDDIK